STPSCARSSLRRAPDGTSPGGQPSGSCAAERCCKWRGRCAWLSSGAEKRPSRPGSLRARREAMVNEAALEDLRASLRGALLAPDDVGYDEVRRVHNGTFVRRPALIARCLGTADVIEAVRFARTHGLELAVPGGGHSVAGKSVCEGGLMLDLSLMKGVHVDPERRTVRAQGGVTWGEFNRETQLHGLATTGGVVSTTGIAGLTLGGGLGWLMGKHGLAADNLMS